MSTIDILGSDDQETTIKKAIILDAARKAKGPTPPLIEVGPPKTTKLGWIFLGAIGVAAVGAGVRHLIKK